MHNVVLSPIDPEKLINDISDRVTQNILTLVKYENKNDQEQEKLLTVQEAASFLNLTVATIYSKVSKGELPVMKKSKRLYFSSLELIAYVKTGRIKTNQEIDREVESYFTNNKKG